MTVDIEYLFPWGWGELMGLAHRGTFDLTQHSKYSGEDMSYFDAETNEKYIPEVIEPSFGCDRSVLTFLIDSYDEDEVEGETRVVLRLHPEIAPIKVAILPLVKNKEIITGKAREIYKMVQKKLVCEYDEAGSIGKRYRRQDEIGTPFCVTIDFDTVEKDDSVTIRHRDTTSQERVKVPDLLQVLSSKLGLE
jgi:glycyl-tRNA synthetase